MEAFATSAAAAASTGVTGGACLAFFLVAGQLFEMSKPNLEDGGSPSPSSHFGGF